MARIQEMMIGISDGTAKAIAGSCNGAVAMAGSDAGTATVLTAANSLVSGGTGGVRLPPVNQVGDTFHIGNAVGSTCTVYPPSGETINGQASAAVVTETGGIFTKVGPTTWIATVSAAA